jgi:2'-5' RNA ligase
MRLILDQPSIQHTINKNTATSYGLTLVAGLPFPAAIGDRVSQIQGKLEALAPGRITWYGRHHLHATLVAPLRGRYRDSPPLQRNELPADLEGFLQDLTDIFAQHQPLPLKLAGIHLTPQGFVMIGENTLVQQLASSLRRYPELDRPKHLRSLHVAVGYFKTDQPFAMDDEERTRLETAMAQLTNVPIGEMLVQRVWLIHYANRTLNRIVGKVPLTLGQTNVLTAGGLLRELSIAPSHPQNEAAPQPSQ